MTKNTMTTDPRRAPSACLMTILVPASDWITPASVTTTAVLLDPSVALSMIILPCPRSAPTIIVPPLLASATTISAMKSVICHFQELSAVAQAARICTRTTQPVAEPDPTSTRTTPAALAGATTIPIAATHRAIDATTPTACKSFNNRIKLVTMDSNYSNFLL